MSKDGAFTRRAMLKFGSGVGAALGAFGIAPAQVRGGSFSGPALVGSSGDAELLEEPGTMKPIEMLINKIERRNNFDSSYKVNGLDPDIASLRSVSPVMKAHMQRVRDKRKMSVLDRLHKRAGHHWWGM